MKIKFEVKGKTAMDAALGEGARADYAKRTDLSAVEREALVKARVKEGRKVTALWLDGGTATLEMDLELLTCTVIAR